MMPQIRIAIFNFEVKSGLRLVSLQQVSFMWNSFEVEMPVRRHRLHGAVVDSQRASTLVPTAPITAIAATTIRPAINAYSRTSPPCSSATNLTQRCLIVFINNFSCSGFNGVGGVPDGSPHTQSIGSMRM